MSRRALVLIGSPKGLRDSNSAHHAQALTATFEAREWSVEWIHLHRAVESQETVDALLQEADASDLILLVAPLYVDGLPAPAIAAMERIAHARSALPETAKAPRLAVLIHCGFIEPAHNATAIEMCREFAACARLEWAGALALGGGGIPSGQAARALVAARDALADGRSIPEEIRRRADRPAMPRLLYILGGNAMWRRVAKKRFGLTRFQLRARPYADGTSF